MTSPPLENIQQAENAPPEVLRLVLPGIMMALTLAALDQNIVGTALPRIVSDLGGLSHLSWVVTAFMLASTTTTPLYGKLSDIYGRRPLFVVAIVLFLIGSVLCGAAQTMGQLISFRGLQGLGAGGLMTLAQTTIGDVISPRNRGRYQGLFGAVFAACSVAGPLLGGVLTDMLSWRWIFYVNLPVGAVALGLIWVGLERVPRPARRTPSIDYAGALLLTVSTTLILLVLSWGGSVYAWSDPIVMGMGAGALALAVGLGWQERRASEPILPPRLFVNPVFNIGTAVITFNTAALYGAMLFMPLFFQLCLKQSPSLSGLMMAPLMAGVITSSILGGRLISRTGRYKKFPVFGLLVATAALTIIAMLVLKGDSVWPLETCLVILGLGLGLVMPTLTVAIQNGVDSSDLGAATSAAAYFRSLGGALGAALSGTLLNSGLQSYLQNANLSVTQSHEMLDKGLQHIAALPEDQRELVVQGYRHALHSNYVAAAAVAGLAFLLVLKLPEKPLRG